MPYMYALYVCLIQYALYSKPYMYALYVCLICMPYMYYNMPYMSAIYALYRIPCIGLGTAAQLCYKLCTCCTCRALNSMSTVDYGLAWLCGVWCVVCGVWCVVAAGDRWHINSTKQLVWAMSHCLCPNCNGTHPGECEECVPRSPGCDVRPPEYDCWMDVRTRTSGWPLYDTGVGLE